MIERFETRMTMRKGMSGRIIRGIGAGAIGQVLNIVGRLLLVPLFLSTWGGQVYGEWLILSSAAALLSLGDLGGQVYFINRLTALWANNSRDEFERVLATGFALFLLIPTSVFILFALFVLTVPLSQWMGIVVTSPQDVNFVMILLALLVATSISQSLLSGIYRAIGAQATSIMLGNIVLGLQLSFSAAVLLTGNGMVPMVIAQILPILIVAIWASFNLRSRLKGVRLFAPYLADMDVARQAFSPSMHFLGIQFAQALIIQGSVLVVGRSLGAVEVAVFSTVRTLVNLARSVLALISHSAWPEFTKLEAGKDLKHLGILFQVVLRISMLATVAYMAIMEMMGRELVDIWLGGRLPYDETTVRLFSIYILFNVFWTQIGNVLMATNLHAALARWQIVTSVSGVVLCYIGVIQWGLPGAVMGLVLGETLPLSLIVVYLLVDKKIGVSAGLIGREALLFVATALLILVFPLAALVVCVATGLYSAQEGMKSL